MDEKIHIGEGELIVHEGPPRVEGFAAEDRLAHRDAKAVRFFAGEGRVFLRIGGGILPQHGALWHAVFHQHIQQKFPFGAVCAVVDILLALDAVKFSGLDADRAAGHDPADIAGLVGLRGGLAQFGA